MPPGGTHKLQEMAVEEARGATRVYVRYSINGSETGMQKEGTMRFLVERWSRSHAVDAP